MNNKERKLFWEELNKPFGTINFESFIDCMPKHLYRYREVNVNNINSLIHNRLYFSTPSHYDDPFDTLISVDFNKIEKEISNYVNPNNKDNIAMQLNTKLDDESIKYLNSILVSFANDYYSLLNKIAKDNIYSICFGEDDLNENLWLKYADAHRGFVIEYKFDSFDTKNIVMTNGKKDSKTNMFIYPIYYSDKPYDATEYYKMLVTITASQSLNLDNNYVKDLLDKSALERHRICLIKKKCHSYDKEWRILVESSIDTTPSCINVKPSAVVLGLKMTDENKKLLTTICKLDDIPVYEIYISKEYKLKKRKIS